MLRDSFNPLVNYNLPSLVNGRKWKAKKSVEYAESVFKKK